MRQLALLETADSVESAPDGKTVWGARQGLILLGALLLLGGLAGGIVVYWDKPQPPNLDAANLPLTWQVWLELRRGVDAGLFKDQEVYNRQIKSFRLRLSAALGSVGMGALLLLAGMLMAKRPAATGPREGPPPGNELPQAG